MSLTPEQIAELRRLNAERTRGPWKADTKERIGENWLLGCLIDCGEWAAPDGQKYSNHIVTTDNICASQMSSGGSGADAAFIAAIANAADALLSAAEENARLREALEMAAKTFRKYEQIHRDKGTDDARKKANSNMIIAQVCERALEPSHD